MQTNTSAGPDTRDDIAPAWLDQLRRDAGDQLAQLAPPSGSEERWRYTPVERLLPASHGGAPPVEHDGLELPAGARPLLALDEERPPGARIVQLDGRLAQRTLSREARDAGVIITSLERAAREHGPLVRSRLGRLAGADDYFSAASLASFRGGTFIHVPAGVALEAPLQALSWLRAAGAAHASRTVVVVDEGAMAVFTDLYGSPALSRESLAMPTVELYVGPRARVGWLTWQAWGSGAAGHCRLMARLAADAQLEAAVVTTGGDLVRTTTEVALAEPGARAELMGAFFPVGQQRFEHWTVQDHRAPHTRSDLAYRGALTGASRSLYYGTIRIHPGASTCDAYQNNRNLVLSSGARADTNPQLEIENNDVRCTHGATVGPLDPEQLYYLMSRGIPLARARELVVGGFLDGVIGRLGWSGQREGLRRAISARMATVDWSGAVGGEVHP